MNIDEKDKAIISLYAQNSNISQDEIAKKIGLSQPSVVMRIKKLRKLGAIESQTGINPLRMGLYVAKVDISSNDTQEILNMFKNCPYFANGFTISGKHNLSLFFVSENIATLESIINSHIRSNKTVTDVDFNIVISSEKDFVVPLVFTHDVVDVPPCGIHTECESCMSYKGKKCMGCPATGNYQGWLY
jgi:DNA-binding Lrp family transcriptional regulator